MTHLTYWYKNKVLYFRTSDGREGSEPATLRTYKNVKDKLCDSLGLTQGYTADDITLTTEWQNYMNKELLQYLIENGWKEYPTYPPNHPERVHKLFCKKVSSLTRCSSNIDKEQDVCVTFTQFDIHDASSEIVSVSIRGEVQNTTWYTIEAYSMSPEYFINNNKDIVDRLSKAWEALHVSN